MEKDLGITEVRGAKANISDLVVYGDGDTFALLCKASSKEQGWMKSTKVANVEDGCIVQVTTQQKNPDGSYSVAEALTYVPRTNIDVTAEPRRLISTDRYRGELTGMNNPKSEVERQAEQDEYKYKNYLEILMQLHHIGHDCHAEINKTLEKVQSLMFK